MSKYVVGSFEYYANTLPEPYSFDFRDGRVINYPREEIVIDEDRRCNISVLKLKTGKFQGFLWFYARTGYEPFQTVTPESYGSSDIALHAARLHVKTALNEWVPS